MYGGNKETDIEITILFYYGPRICECFRNKLIFYGEELLAPRPTPKLEDHPLSAVRDCLFNIFTASLHNWRASPPSTAMWSGSINRTCCRE
jgi:hypothetical protein